VGQPLGGQRQDHLVHPAQPPLPLLHQLRLEGARPGMRCQQLAGALGLQVVPAKVEGVRSKAKRLVERGWARQVRPGVFTALVVPAG
jgi:hypothetical protein